MLRDPDLLRVSSATVAASPQLSAVLAAARQGMMSDWICDGCARRFDTAASSGPTNITVEEVRLRAEAERLRQRILAIDTSKTIAASQLEELQDELRTTSDRTDK